MSLFERLYPNPNKNELPLPTVLRLGVLCSRRDLRLIFINRPNRSHAIARTGGFVSSISLWELGLKIKKGKLDIGFSVPTFFSDMQRIRGLTILPVDESVWLENLNLDWNHPDPVDRTIVATARLRRLPIVTADRVIRRFYRKVIW